jgi:2'-5' RNA ligase
MTGLRFAKFFSKISANYFSLHNKSDFMDKNIVSIPGYVVCEYLLALKPHEDLYRRIYALKEEFSKNYNAPMAHSTKPHITLIKFWGYEMIEQKLLGYFAAVASGIKPFKIELSNFGTFPAHTIYINVTTKTPIQYVVQQLKGAQKLMTLDKEHKPHFITESHLIICRKLKPWQYEQSSLEYTNRHFSGRFMAESMTLLKRPATEKTYTQAGIFQFQNASGYTKQGNLFI